MSKLTRLDCERFTYAFTGMTMDEFSQMVIDSWQEYVSNGGDIEKYKKNEYLTSKELLNECNSDVFIDTPPCNDEKRTCRQVYEDGRIYNVITRSR